MSLGYDEIERLIELSGAQAVVDALDPYLTDARRTRIEAILPSRLAGLHLAVESPSDPHNAAAVVRSAEAFGVTAVHVVAAEGALLARRTTQGAFTWMETRHHGDLGSFLEHERARGHALYGAAMDGSLTVGEIPVDRPLCLVFGNEQRGLSEEARAACDDTYRIPMFGMSESLNLSVSAAISTYEVTRRMRAHLGADGDFDGPARLRERARGYLRSVNARFARALLAPGKDGAAPRV